MLRPLFLSAVSLIIATSSTAFAQDIDLSDQREESQIVNHVTGYKIDHKGLVINPTPQQVT